MESSAEVLEIALIDRGIKRDKDVEELYLSNRNLVEIVNLNRFRNLKRLWLNGNKLERVKCFSTNFHLSELYLHDNQLRDIHGCLRHLTCLTVLTLQNNQLTKLDNIIEECDRMKSLSVLNLFNNPVAQEPGYRLFVIHCCPSLTLLDRAEVTKAEQVMSFQIYKQFENQVKDRIAFGRKSEGPPSLYYGWRPKQSSSSFRPVTAVVGTNNLRSNQTSESPDDAVNTRLLKKSLTIYSTFDWSKVPRLEERRKMEVPLRSAHILTYVYR
ncbi:unnamed protein product [Lymnaea stagnalis]|uniref:Leucine-rich repeat-containing protein 72 n=1 Tax=Lymnaea stagnalis TaxID=6523 RepID=A0AAV2H782_LYMST